MNIHSHKHDCRGVLTRKCKQKVVFY
uniref:Uncharacterized protein n=1 Tax=Rhizophora mucronata TaxID=61149 RepID=A0A2P2JCH8_RHIMU